MAVASQVDMTQGSRRLILIGAMLLLAGACRDDEGPRFDRFLEGTPYERYVHTLQRSGIDGTAMARDWLAAGLGALRTAPPIAPPFRESGFWDYRESDAVAYRFSARRGQLVLIDVDVETDEWLSLFIDLYQALEDSTRSLRRVASADTLETAIVFEAFMDGEYLVRVQPEILRGGRYTVTIRHAASLDFPVVGLDTRAIRSGFGAPRDGGQRDHHGVDIFAPRGTPVIAADDGWASARTNRLGGNVVWLRADGGGSLYYAHLESQAVGRRERVRRGDTLGFVGNSGNARTTPPHLHFGVYSRTSRRGPADPYWYLFEPSSAPPLIVADLASVGSWRRVARSNVQLAKGPSTRASTVRLMERYSTVRVVGAVADWYRVELPNGMVGFVDAALTEPIDAPVREERLVIDLPVRTRPLDIAAVVETASAGAAVPVLGAFDNYLLVQSPSGRTGWITLD
jgi:murein DD-endopeptidase MepM/ murein hydrolase activator NlpD